MISEGLLCKPAYHVSGLSSTDHYCRGQFLRFRPGFHRTFAPVPRTDVASQTSTFLSTFPINALALSDTDSRLTCMPSRCHSSSPSQQPTRNANPSSRSLRPPCRSSSWRCCSSSGRPILSASMSSSRSSTSSCLMSTPWMIRIVLAMRPASWVPFLQQ